MAYTESNMLPLGTEAPDFSLPDTVSGRMMTLGELASDKGTVVMFWCNHCPYVLHVSDAVVQVAREYQARGMAFVAISSNDVSAYPEDAPDKMAELAAHVGYTFPYLYDESQEVARAYDAACTPDFYVFDGQRKLVYRGQFDDSRPRRNETSVTGSDLREALDAVLAGKPVAERQRPSGGCNIKWKNN